MGPLATRLERLGLGRYAELFAANGIDFDILPDLTDADLEKLGVAVGDRIRILKAARSLPASSADGGKGEGREAERRQLTVMFADLVNSTKLAASLDPEDMKDVIDRYQKAVGDEVARFGGYVAKPLGDGLLIYFGWPQAHEDDAERALRSALAAVAAVRNLTSPAGLPIAARIGIATGEVVVGDFVGGVGEAGAVVGETPNLAARLQSVAGDNSVTVAERTMKLAGRQFAFTDLGEQSLKGFDNPVRAWRVDGARASESRFDALHAGSLGAIIGREHEIGSLLARWEEASEGDCQLMLITGEAGIGKSRLVAEILNRLPEGGHNRIRYQGSPLHTNTALYPVVRHLESKAGFLPDDPAARKLQRLAGIIPGGTPREHVAFRFLADLMAVPAPGADTADGPRPSADEQKEAAFGVLADSARHDTETAPLLVVVEDAHWLDASTLDLIERLLDRLRHCRAMVVVTYRPDFVPPWAGHANVGLLSLGRLGRRDSRAIVNSLLSAGATLSPELANDIVAKGDGVPLFVEELTDSALAAARAGADRVVEIPSTLRDSLSERLDRLGSAKEVAQFAATFGREFALDLLAAALGRSEADLKNDLGRLMAIEVVFQASRSDQRYVFKHALLQDAAYESMLKSKRREVHGKIAHALEALRPAIAETEPEVLATHFSEAGNQRGAGACWLKAGHLALRNSAYREAVVALTKALSLLPDDEASVRIDASRAMATACFSTGDFRAMHENLELAAARAEATGDQYLVAEIAIQQSHALSVFGGKIPAARIIAERALRIAQALNDEPLVVGARFTLGHVLQYGGDFVESIKTLTPNLPSNLANQANFRDVGNVASMMLDSLGQLAVCHGSIGDFERAAELCQMEKDLPGSHATAFNRSLVYCHPGMVLVIKGDGQAAAATVSASLDAAREGAIASMVAYLGGLLGFCKVLQGGAEEGIGLMRRGLVACHDLSYREGETRVLGYLATTMLLQGRPDEGLDFALDALRIAEEFGYGGQEADALYALAGALAQKGIDLEEAGNRAAQALVLTQRRRMRPGEAHCRRVLGDIASKRGDEATARESYNRARALYADMRMKFWLERTP